MSEEAKAPYNEKADAAKAIVEKQKKELQMKGYYTLENGSKSTDTVNAALLAVKKKRSKKTSNDESDDEEEKKEEPVKPKRAKKTTTAAAE